MIRKQHQLVASEEDLAQRCQVLLPLLQRGLLRFREELSLKDGVLLSVESVYGGQLRSPDHDTTGRRVETTVKSSKSSSLEHPSHDLTQIEYDRI